MFDTPVINVAIGLVFCFAATALAASTLTEALASLVKLRANTLVSGVQKMFNDPKFEGLALSIYNHALVHPQGDGGMKPTARFWSYRGPSYIRARDFAIATVDSLQEVPGDMARLQAKVDALPDPQLRLLLQGMLVRAKGDVDHLQGQIADWFNASMDRVSGNYKRQAQLISFLLGLLLAATINIDSTYVAMTLWQNPALAGKISDQVAAITLKEPDAQAAMAQLWKLPVGPDLLMRRPCDGGEIVCVVGHRITGYNLLGWLITAVAAVFGAPFWFDMLQKLVQLRGSGPKPGEAAKA
ncbi:MAG: hypothetical protein JSR59_03445 [Proteobacteria bacterium]|nr:hypothetical protein [Pseudomonadota bacterium]